MKSTALSVPQALPLSQVISHEATDKRIDILRRVGAVGSISEAARGANVSYKAAWQALETLANLAGTALVEKVVGGAGGGGAALTPAGVRVLQAADALTAARQEVLARLQQSEGLDTPLATPRRAALALRTSMRNQFPCAVGRIAGHQGQARVQLLLPDGTDFYARITRESTQLLGLRPQLQVLALCKATSVQVAPAFEPAPGRNILQGVVTRASRAAGGGEVGLALRGALHRVGLAAPGHGLRKGQSAMATVEETGVVIATLD